MRTGEAGVRHKPWIECVQVHLCVLQALGLDSIYLPSSLETSRELGAT